MTKYEILRTDIGVLERMVAEIEEYLKSECTHWVMGDGELPRLTLGGYLMREHRLLFLCKDLPAVDQQRLQRVVTQFEKALEEQVVRFEKRAHQELHARLREWVSHLRSMTTYKTEQLANYVNVVDTRVVIEAMVDKLQTPPYQLERQVLEELEVLDQNLSNRWQEGEFIWPAVWQLVYPRKKYWWLYGHPKQAPAQKWQSQEKGGFYVARK
jgi:hypothetical protein